MFLGLDPRIEAVLALFAGLTAGYLIRQLIASVRVSQAESKAQALLADSKSKSQDILIEAKNKAIKVLEDDKKEEKERNVQLARIENILTRKEGELEQKEKELGTERENLKSKAIELVSVKTSLEQDRQKQVEELERISRLKQDEAKQELINKVEEEYKNEFYEKLIKLERQNREELDKKAREILTTAIQRYSSSHIADATTTVVSLPSDEVKGKIIGKEGRNIKTIERLTGVDIIIDDTPEALVVSGFDPVRRQIAKLAIDKLIADGRIHPAKIEETVEKAHNEINEKIKEAGEAALFEIGAGAVDPKLVYLLVRLAFRTSFGQNVLLHSIEMAHVAGMLAAELGADVPATPNTAWCHAL